MARNGKRVVVTGYGMITPIGKNSRETFANAQKRGLRDRLPEFFRNARVCHAVSGGRWMIPG